jgi:hypothetical protein
MLFLVQLTLFCPCSLEHRNVVATVMGKDMYILQLSIFKSVLPNTSLPFYPLQIALQLVRQGVSNEPVQEALTTASEEPTSSDSANVKDETLKDPAVEDASLTSSTTEPAFEEAKEVKREGGTSEVSVILFDFDIFC